MLLHMAPVWHVAAQRRTILTHSAYLLGIVIACTLELVLLHQLSPRFFWTDDAQAQFSPQYWWLGHMFNSTGHRIILDPDQGIAGNLLNDPQSGALAPILWGIQSCLALFTNINHAAWAFACGILMCTALGLYTLLSILKVSSWASAAAAVTVPASGFFIWFGSTWWPVLTSGCFFVWGLTALFSRREWAVPLVGLLLYAMASMGNPYGVPFFLLICLLQWSLLFRQGSLTVRQLVSRFLSLAAGIALSVPIYLGTVGSSEVVGRPVADGIFGNSAFNVANPWDILFGSATTLPAMSTWSGALMLAPICATFILSTSLIPLINWSAALRDSRFVALVLVSAITLIAVQLPSIVGPFRYPFRYLLIWQFTYPTALLYGFTHYQSRNRKRVGAAFAIVALTLITSWSRIPTMLKLHVTWACAIALALSLALKLTSKTAELQGSRRIAATGVVLLLAFCGPLISVQMMRQLNTKTVTAETQPLRVTTSGYQVSRVRVQDFKQSSAIKGQAVTVLNFNSTSLDQGESSGILYGNMNLLAEKKTGYGEVAVDQKFLSAHVQRNYLGNLTADAARPLLKRAFGKYRWIDVTSSNTLLVSDDAPKKLLRYLRTSPLWQPGASQNVTWYTFHRSAPLPGRISATSNANILQGTATVATVTSGKTGTYRIHVKDRKDQATIILSSPYWPGYSATWNGHPLHVTTLGKALVKIQIPAGSKTTGTLSVVYKPIAITSLLPMTAIGLMLLISAVIIGRRNRRKSYQSE
jgi:hypothetical protein